MARKRKDGRRAQGIQAKKGKLYVVISKNVLINGRKVAKRQWIATGLSDIPDNLTKAVDMRRAYMKAGNGVLTADRDISVESYVDLYLARKKRTVADTTFSGYLYRGKRIKEFFGSVKVKSLTTMDVEQFLDALVTEHKSQARTLKDIKALLVSIIDQAVKDGLVADNPAKEATVDKALVLKNAKVKNDDDDFFSYKEAQLFLVIVESHALYELFYITLFFGLRREEVLGLRWSCVDLDKKEFRINHTVTKGTSVNRLNSTKTEASARKYPLTEEQVKMFEHLKAKEAGNRALFGSAYHDNEYIFKHEDGSPYYPDYPTKAFGRVIKAHPELPQHVTFHGLRASCVSILVHEGFDVKRIQKWVGHSDINTTLKIYARVREKEAKQEILNGMNEIIHTKAY